MTDTIHIRKATTADAGALSDIAFRSKAHWGYPAAFIEACRPVLTITPRYLSQAPVFLAELGGRPLGFAGLSMPDASPELVYLFVEPDLIGKGVGRKLWDRAIAEARALAWPSLKIVSDPNAEPFYRRMGAVRVGERASEADPSRTIPILEFRIPPAP